MAERTRIVTCRRVLGFLFLCFAAGMANAWAKDYKQCILLDVQKPSNKVVFESDNATNNVVLGSEMFFFRSNDSFNVSVTNKCSDPGDLYVTFQVPS